MGKSSCPNISHNLSTIGAREKDVGGGALLTRPPLISGAQSTLYDSSLLSAPTLHYSFILFFSIHPPPPPPPLPRPRPAPMVLCEGRILDQRGGRKQELRNSITSKHLLASPLPVSRARGPEKNLFLNRRTLSKFSVTVRSHRL